MSSHFGLALALLVTSVTYCLINVINWQVGSVFKELLNEHASDEGLLSPTPFAHWLAFTVRPASTCLQVSVIPNGRAQAVNMPVFSGSKKSEIALF